MKFRAISADATQAASVLDHSGQDLSWIGREVSDMAVAQPAAYQRLWQPRLFSASASSATALYDIVSDNVGRTVVEVLWAG
jgi:hypothetical protein